jgi:hypothetical protein
MDSGDENAMHTRGNVASINQAGKELANAHF